MKHDKLNIGDLVLIYYGNLGIITRFTKGINKYNDMYFVFIPEKPTVTVPWYFDQLEKIS